LRLFVAVELSEACKRALLRTQRLLSAFDRMARWTRAEQMHLTLSFLGETPEDRVASVCSVLEAACGAVGPFEIKMHRAGCFPPRGRVRIVWVGVNAPGDMLNRTQRLIDHRLRQIGMTRDERAFAAHLTIGRVRSDDSDGGLRTAVARVPVARVAQCVSAVALMESNLDSGGAVYMPVGRWPLRGSADES